MDWLSNLMKWLVSDVFGLNIDDRWGGSLHFFLYDTVKIFILLSVLIFIISYVQSHFPPERTRKILGRFSGVGANILGALLGTVTPFCSCSSIPLFIGFYRRRAAYRRNIFVSDFIAAGRFGFGVTACQHL